MHDRVRPAIGALSCIALGLLSRKCPIGVSLWDKSFGDIIYPVMFGYLLRVAKPNMRAGKVGFIAFAICFGLELFQTTGIPATFPQPFRFLFGTTFAWHDVFCDVVGGFIVAGLLSLESRWRSRA